MRDSITSRRCVMSMGWVYRLATVAGASLDIEFIGSGHPGISTPSAEQFPATPYFRIAACARSGRVERIERGAIRERILRAPRANHMNGRLVSPRRALALLPLVAFVAITALFFWPDDFCNDASCARKRFDLFVEVDSFRGVEPVAFEVDTDDGPVSARSILLSGGVDLTLEPDDDDLPYDPESGPLDRADLYQYATAWRNRAVAAGSDAHLYALIAPALISDRGERLFGLMFDSQGREGIAIAPQQTARTFKLDPELIPLLQLRTLTHEMLHALNRRHLDAAPMRDGRLSIEAPTRCITTRDGAHWRMTEVPSMALSPTTIAFFQRAAPRDVLPGGMNTPFDALRSSASECADIRSFRPPRAPSRWEVARRRVLGALGIDSAFAQDADDADASPTAPLDASSLILLLQTQEAAYPLGYPIAIRVIAQNRSSQSVPLKGRLTPPYGIVRIEYRPLGNSEWRAFKPLMWFEPIDDEIAALGPDGYAEQTAAIYFGEDGWTFAAAGEYEVRATVQPSEESGEIVSNTVRLRVAAPATDAERAALAPLLDADGELDAQVGRLLTFGGRITNEDAYAAIAETANLYATTALGSALKLTLGSQRLSPPIDPLTGARPKPRFADAHSLFEDTCTDSGIAALKFELLERYKDDLPEHMRNRLQASAAAWDGATRDRRLVPSYSDPALRQVEASLHFCFNETHLRREVRPAARRIAQSLARTDTRRIVIVGHTDYQGHCQFNDALALERAESVRRELLRAGVPDAKIATLSLGERRPLDFADTDTAKQLNRRVEILFEPPQVATEAIEDAHAKRSESIEADANESDASETDAAAVERVLPRCED
jgi:outer membrane protein OmpA-like peptidoglycan-associated protein